MNYENHHYIYFNKEYRDNTCNARLSVNDMRMAGYSTAKTTLLIKNKLLNAIKQSTNNILYELNNSITMTAIRESIKTYQEIYIFIKNNLHKAIQETKRISNNVSEFKNKYYTDKINKMNKIRLNNAIIEVKNNQNTLEEIENNIINIIKMNLLEDIENENFNTIDDVYKFFISTSHKYNIIIKELIDIEFKRRNYNEQSFYPSNETIAYLLFEIYDADTKGYTGINGIEFPITKNYATIELLVENIKIYLEEIEKNREIMI